MVSYYHQGICRYNVRTSSLCRNLVRVALYHYFLAQTSDMNWRNVQEVLGDSALLWHTEGLPKYSLLVGNNILAIKIGFEKYKPLNRSNNRCKYGDKLEVVSSHVPWVNLFIVENLVLMRYLSVDNCCLYWRWICWDVCMCKYGYCVSLGRFLFCF